MALNITLNIQKKIAMETTLGKQAVDCCQELLSIKVEIKTLTYLSIRLGARIGPVSIKSLVSWEVIIVRTNFE